MKKQKILIFGGSFDPPHSEHIRILNSAVKFLKPDKVYVFPAFRTPLKNAPFASSGMRLEMAKIAFKNINGKITVDPYEIKRGKKTYAYEVLDYLKSRHRQAEFYLLVGSDCLENFKKWKKYKYLLRNATLLAAKRKGYISGSKTDLDYKTPPGVFKKISSTEIRRNILLTGAVAPEVSFRIGKYISKHKLYGLSWHGWLKKNLSPGRYIHTVNSTALAAKLADIYGEDKTDAVTAALLHDCAKGFSDAHLIGYVFENELKIPMAQSIISHQPSVFHSFVSADIAKKVFKITDKKILRAIELHTLGDADMTIFDKIIYIADVASIDRKYDSASVVRKAALTSLDDALLLALKTKLEHVTENNKWLCLHSVNLWNNLVMKKP